MRLFLIRHGETEHNVAGLLAGVTDSLLTNHGLNQAQRLGSYLIKKKGYVFTQVFTSDLKRAYRTANEICLCQSAEFLDFKISSIQLTLLREQDFGSFELLPWNRSQETRMNDPKPGDAGFRPKETAASMKSRADTFLDDSLLPLLALDNESEQFVAIVSHGLFLGALWRALLLRLRPSKISLDPHVSQSGSKKPLEHLPAWSNTGYLELSLREIAAEVDDTSKNESSTANPTTEHVLAATIRIMAVNSKEHLVNLKRTRGGIGSSASDDKQQQMEGFFKKRNVSFISPELSNK